MYETVRWIDGNGEIHVSHINREQDAVTNARYIEVANETEATRQHVTCTVCGHEVSPHTYHNCPKLNDDEYENDRPWFIDEPDMPGPSQEEKDFWNGIA